MFDTLQVTNDLRKAGFAEPQAEAVVSAFSAISRDMMTRAEMKAELKTTLATLESRLTWRMVMMSGFIVGAVGLIIKL